MRRAFFFGILILPVFFFQGRIPSAFASSSSIIISEVSIAGEKTSDEFIELFNQSDQAVFLSGMQLRRRTQSGSESSVRVFPKDFSVPPHSYFLFAHSQGIFASPFADTDGSSSALANDNSIGLFTRSGAGGVLIDSVTWGKGALFAPTAPVFANPTKNTSLVRDRTTLLFEETAVMTPTNSKGETWAFETEDDDPPPDPLPENSPTSTVRFSELLPNPEGDEGTGEFIELYNASLVSLSLDGFRIHDASQSAGYTFPSGVQIEGQGYMVLWRSTSGLALNNSDEVVTLRNKDSVILDTVFYKKTKEGVSLNFGGLAQPFRGGTPTPGLANLLNTLPATKEKVPKKGYRYVPVAFDARGKDEDGDALKYTWDFGDDHRSYKEETTHTYEKNGTYQVTLTTSDGSDDVVETFHVNIESFPKAQVRITALVPNPHGTDSENEWIIIENRGKKEVDLKGFSIATGSTSDKIVNHPVREKFVIPPKSERKLARTVALFTLPNKKGKIELRAPDGEVIQKIKYKSEVSLKEDLVYRKEKGKTWQWEASSGTEDAKELGEESEVTPSIIVPISEAVALETLPLEEAAPSPSEISLPTPEASGEEKQVLGVQTVSVTPLDTYTLSQTQTSPARHFFQVLLGDLNAWLNTWQNTKYAP